MVQPELTALDKPRQSRQLEHTGRAVASVRPADAVR
jgi:hypothetical protein